MFICENCNITHNGSYASKRFCSIKCARSFSTKNSREEINVKVSKKLKGRESPIKGRTSWKKGKHLVEYKTIVCKQCNNSISVRLDSNRRFCGKSCAAKYSANIRLSNNTHNGYPSRKDKSPSFAEKIVIDILNYNNIEYTRDKKINRFFGDFVFESKKIVLEIDGKQHESRKDYDTKRDEIIESEGYKVVRIKWVHNNFEYIKSKVENFLLMYDIR